MFLRIPMNVIDLPLGYVHGTIAGVQPDPGQSMLVPLRGLLPSSLARQLVPPVSVHPAIKVSDVGDKACAHDEVFVSASRGPVIEVVKAEGVALEK